jgi:hypothetical protein
MHLKLVTVTHENSSYQVFRSFYEEMRCEFSISADTKNLFLSLAESLAQILNVTSCYVCGETNTGDHWPWEARELFMRLPSPNTEKASGSLKFTSLEITVSPAQKANSSPRWGI